MKSVRSRFDILKTLYGGELGLEFEDLFDNNEPAGTKVILKLPTKRKNLIAKAVAVRYYRLSSGIVKKYSCCLNLWIICDRIKNRISRHEKLARLRENG